MSPRITVIIAAPAFDHRGRRLPCKFDALFEGRLLVPATRLPLLDGARALLGVGFDPDAMVVMRHQGSTVDSLRAKIAIAAALTVDEAGTPRFARWKAFRAEAVEAPIAQTGGAAPEGLPTSKSTPVGSHSLESVLEQYFSEQGAIDYAWRRARRSKKARLPLSEIMDWARAKYPSIDETGVRQEIARRFERSRRRRHRAADALSTKRARP